MGHTNFYEWCDLTKKVYLVFTHCNRKPTKFIIIQNTYFVLSYRWPKILCLCARWIWRRLPLYSNRTWKRCTSPLQWRRNKFVYVSRKFLQWSWHSYEQLRICWNFIIELFFHELIKRKTKKYIKFDSFGALRLAAMLMLPTDFAVAIYTNFIKMIMLTLVMLQ